MTKPKRKAPAANNNRRILISFLSMIIIYFAVQGLLAKTLTNNETPNHISKLRSGVNMQEHSQGERHHHVSNQHHSKDGLSSHVETLASVKMPRLIYGCAWKEERTANLVQLALRHGFRGIDTAAQPQHYNEKGAGDGISAFLAEQDQVKREDLFVQTKFNRKHAPTLVDDANSNIKDHVRVSLETSLENLQTSYVDSLVMHSPYPDLKDTFEAWEAMEEAVDSGQARQLGISNVASLHDLKRLHAMARIKPAVVQMRFHRKTGFERETRKWCAEHGIYFQSFWTLTANSKRGRAGQDAVLSPIVQTIAKKHQVSPQVLFYRWVMSDGVTCPLDGTSSEEHMDEDLKAVDIALTDEDRDAISNFVYRDL